MFEHCETLNNLYIPNTITKLSDSSIFNYCYSLRNFIIPETITSLGYRVFGSCYSLANLKIPSAVTSIGSYAFADCFGMNYYDFSNHTSVPTLEGTNAFTNIPSDCKIIVPDNLYDTWIAATNWSTYASYIIKKTDWEAL